MNKRSDLLELTPASLTALSNPGFVKRAQKDVDEGKLPAIEEQDDGTVIARYSDGAITTMAAGQALREARCTCPASGLCRHRVTLVLAYQAQSAAQPAAPAPQAPALWCPSCFEEQAKELPRTALALAARLVEAGIVIRLRSGDIPTARLPMCDVRFLSRSNLSLARCDCQQGDRCGHIALAVQAFAQAQRQQPGFDAITVELHAPQAARDAGDARQDSASAVAAVVALARQLWLDGTSQQLLAIEHLFEMALQRCGALGWSWMIEALMQLRQTVVEQHARSSTADPVRLLDLTCNLVNRAQAAHAETSHPIPAREILGIGVKGEVALDHLRLIPLGAVCTQDDNGDQVRLIWADPDSLSVTVVQKSWPLPEAGETRVPPRDRRLLGQPLHKIAASQIITNAAKRRANGLLTIGAGATQTSVMPASASTWDGLGAPLCHASSASLRAYLTALAPDFVRPLQVVEHLHVLPVHDVVSCGWDAAAQTLHAVISTSRVYDEGPDLFRLRLQHRSAAACAVDATARAMGGEWGEPIAVAGVASLEAGVVWIMPTAILTARALVVPQLAKVAPAIGLTNDPPPAAPAITEVISSTRAVLAQCLRQGLRHQGRQALERASVQAQELRAAGLARCAFALERTFAELQGTAENLATGMAALHALLEQLDRRAHR